MPQAKTTRSVQSVDVAGGMGAVLWELELQWAREHLLMVGAELRVQRRQDLAGPRQVAGLVQLTGWLHQLCPYEFASMPAVLLALTSSLQDHQ